MLRPGHTAQMLRSIKRQRHSGEKHMQEYHTHTQRHRETERQRERDQIEISQLFPYSKTICLSKEKGSEYRQVIKELFMASFSVMATGRLKAIWEYNQECFGQELIHLRNNQSDRRHTAMSYYCDSKRENGLLWQRDIFWLAIPVQEGEVTEQRDTQAGGLLERRWDTDTLTHIASCHGDIKLTTMRGKNKKTLVK